MVINGLTIIYWLVACAFVGVTSYLWGHSVGKA